MPPVGPILVSNVLTATNTDVLANTRLQTVPAGGNLTFRIQANLNNATNGWLFSIEMPGGDTPINLQPVPGNNPSLDGVIDVRTAFIWTGDVGQGGHCTLGLTEVGTAIVFFQVLYTPRVRTV